jgi:hypothetical protein
MKREHLAPSPFSAQGLDSMADGPLIVSPQWAELRRPPEAKSRTAGAGA